MAVRVGTVEELNSYVGKLFGVSEWAELPFEQIVAFADATGDHQWIHVDRERIAKESPFGAPIAHGYLSMSLIAGKFFEVLELDGFKMIINYGCNKVRFPNPMKAGARFRLSLGLVSVTDVGKGWHEALMSATIEIEGEKKPACVAEVVYRFLG